MMLTEELDFSTKRRPFMTPAQKQHLLEAIAQLRLNGSSSREQSSQPEQLHSDSPRVHSTDYFPTQEHVSI